MIEGRERDGIFETNDFIHCIECTVSRQKDKAAEDGRKLEKLIRRLNAQFPDKLVKGWFVTLNEPTADQRTVIKSHRDKIVACSYDQFRTKLVDIRSYLTLRQRYPFGSVRDPKTGATDFDLKYTPLDLLGEEGSSVPLDNLIGSISSGARYVITGDYGAGKSSTAREIFFRLGRTFWEGSTVTFPLHLNLRDHHGQTDPVEAIERHARNVGYKSASSLVAAWRAGYCAVILDGFDEIASAG